MTRGESIRVQAGANQPLWHSTIYGAVDRNRTGVGAVHSRGHRHSATTAIPWCTGRESNPQMLSRRPLETVCLPVPPPVQNLAPRAGFKPAAFRFVAGRSVRTELSGQSLASRAGFKPAASRFGGARSFGLSYRDNLASSAGLKPATCRIGAGRAVRLRHEDKWSG